MASKELEAAVAARDAALAKLTNLQEMANGWLQSEGRVRVLISLQYPQRQWLKQLLLIKRSAAFRQMCTSPVALTVKSERARKGLRRLSAAQRTCAWLQKRNVQVRRYQEGTCTMHVLDGKQDAPLAKLTSDEERRNNLASEISTYLGETVSAHNTSTSHVAPPTYPRSCPCCARRRCR